VIFVSFKTNKSIHPKRNFLNERGIVLIASIMLIIFVAIAVLGTTMFLVQRLRHTVSKENNARLIDLAHAGLHGAIYMYRFFDQGAPNGYFVLGPVAINANDSYRLGASPADLLMVNTTVTTAPNSNNITNWRLQNATNSQAITIDRMVVTWGNAKHLRRIRIGGVNVSGSINLVSPANVNITNFTLDTTPSTYVADLRFSGTGNIANTTVDIQFIMTDGSSKTVRISPASKNFNFTLGSTGRITGTNMYRTIQAVYNAATGRIIDYDETNTQY